MKIFPLRIQLLIEHFGLESDKSSLTVIVPFYNEETTLKKSVTNLINENVADSIILVDDYSSDNSLKIAESLVREHPNLLLLKKETNEGKGSAVYFAKPYVKTTHVIVHDAGRVLDKEDQEYLIKSSLEMWLTAEVITSSPSFSS